jgi:ATP-dependent Lhr-like helicase
MRWSELRPLQANSINAFFGSENPLILSASTASGKTEAAFLPVLSAIADEPEGSVRAMYVGPLKALINDQFSRLEDLCLHAGIAVHRWHGDVSASDKQRFRSNPGGVLLITPESLESAFINYGNQVPRIFGGLRYIVIDELHSFVADVRGVHLRSLISRLGQAIGKLPRTLGLSATLSDFDSARRFLKFDHPEQVEVIEDKETTRSLRIGIRAYPRPVPRPEGPDEGEKRGPRLATTALEAYEDLIALTSGPTKHRPAFEVESPKEDTALRNLALDVASVFRSNANLIFTNSRGLAEMLADEIHQICMEQHWPRNPFVLHHGSLSKEVREDVENRLKKGEKLSAFCTSTLEMGIDIGSVHSVGQLGPPWSVAALVQRLGRSGRREGEASILRLYSLDPPPSPKAQIEELLCPQLLRSIALVELMLTRWLEPFDNDPYHFSTLVHQTLSLLRQTGGCSAKRIFDTLVTNGAFTNVKSDQMALIIRSLAAHELIEQTPTGDLILAPKGEAVTHGRDFYAAFTGGAEYSIRNQQLTIGKLPASSIPPENEHLLLNGRRWKVACIDHRSLVVEVIPATSRKKPIFMGSGGNIHRTVAEKMREIMIGSSIYQYLHRDAAKLLDGGRAYAAKLGLAERSWVEDAGCCILFPWTGSKGLETLRLCAELDEIQVEKHQMSLTYHVTPDKMADHMIRVAEEAFTPRQIAEAMKDRLRDKFDEFIPEDLLHLTNSQRAISISDASDSARTAIGLNFGDSPAHEFGAR